MKIRRDIAGLLACVATSAMILVATPLPASADDLLDAHQDMPLINIGSAKCFEPTIPQGGPSNWAGLPIQQRTCSPRVTIQYYQFQSQGPVDYNDQGRWLGQLCTWLGCIPAGTEGYLIRNLDTNLCLDVRDGSKSDGAVVQQWECDKNARSMLWYVESGDYPGMFKVRNFNSDRCLDVKGGSSAEYAQLQQYHCTPINSAQNFSQKFPAFWQDVVDLNGRWTDGSTRSAVIYTGLGSIVIDMSAFNRGAARGRFYGPHSITVDFPDDATWARYRQLGLHGPMVQFGRRNLESKFALPNFVLVSQKGPDAMYFDYGTAVVVNLRPERIANAAPSIAGCLSH